MAPSLVEALGIDEAKPPPKPTKRQRWLTEEDQKLKELIEKHGGKIQMASELGVGTTFWFDLALAQSDKDELLTQAINNTDNFSSSKVSKIV